MTAVVVGVLVALAVLLWSAAGTAARQPALCGRVGEEAAAEVGTVSASPLHRSGWRGARRRRQRTEQAEADALELLDGLAPALRAGLPPVAALRLVASSHQSPSATSGAGGSDWTWLQAVASRGEALAPPWSAYAAAIGSDDLRLVAAAWSLCENLGSPLAPTVTTVAEVVRRRRAVRHRLAAALAGPQATMRVLTALPLSGPFVAVVVGVPPSELYAGAAALTSLVLGLALLLLGRTWASRMVRAVTLEQAPERHRRRWVVCGARR